MASTLLGFDFGLKRIGVAVADAAIGQARALTTIARDWDSVEQLLSEWQPSACVVGLPLTQDGGEQDITATARRFARRLEQSARVPVHLCDERMSSIAAQAMLRAQRASGQRRRKLAAGDIDSLAAQIILQQWLDGDGVA